MSSDALHGALNGILIVDKPQNFTSHDVVAKLRGILQQRRIGHGGTLDPLATGVLPVFIGGATRAADFAAAKDKEYRAGFTLGLRTDTQDITGQTLEVCDKTVSTAQVEAVIAGLVGKQMQIPPMYSAVKVQGKKLYELARQGKQVDRAAREITVMRMTLEAFDGKTGMLRALVSKGTYIRSLVDELGVRLGTFAAMHSLQRTRAGEFTLEQALSLEQIRQYAAAGQIAPQLRPVDALFMQYPAVHLTPRGVQRAQNGAIVFPTDTEGMPQADAVLCRVYYQGIFIMLGQVKPLQRGGFGLFVYKKFREII